MAEREIETISHLLEVERNAREITRKAQEEADRKVGAAKAEAEKKFRAAFERMVAEHEGEYAARAAEITRNAENSVAEFRSRVSGAPKDKAAFGAFLDGVLFA